MGKIALVTGCSSGIGLETSLALGREGFYTFATMRDLNKNHEIKQSIEKENLPIEIIGSNSKNFIGNKLQCAKILDLSKTKLDRWFNP